MAAAAFKVTLSVMVDGRYKSIYMAASDVAAQGWTFPDGGTALPLGTGQAVIKDIILSAAGTDTTNSEVYVNGVYTGYTVVHSANVYSVLNRQVMQTPIVLNPGANIKFIQRA